MSEGRLRVVRSWLLCAFFALCACSRATQDADIGSETNWLRQCDEDADCTASTCVCGVCSADCTDDADCPDGLRCERETSVLYAQACGVDMQVRGLCAPECERDGECGAGFSCIDGACAPAATSAEADGGLSGSVGGAAGLGGPRQLVADAHLDLTPECLPDLERPIGSGVGQLDIRGDTAGAGCRTPYRLNLRVRNLLSERVLVNRVDVLLSNLAGQSLVFDTPDAVLPNPLSLSVTGSVPGATGTEPGTGAIIAEVIPAAYAPLLAEFVGDQLAIRAQLSGETLGGVPVRANAFDYRVSICSGCLTFCMAELEPAGTTVDDLVGGRCDDNAAADARVCIDPGC